MRWAVLWSLALTACEPVLVREPSDPAVTELAEVGAEAAGVVMGPSERRGELPDASVPAPPVVGTAPPRVFLQLLPPGCGRCFDVRVEVSGGAPPYVYEWNGQTAAAERRLCGTPGAAPIELQVVAVDADGRRSEPYTARLVPSDDCGPVASPEPATGAPLCLEDGSFEAVSSPWAICSADPFPSALWWYLEPEQPPLAIAPVAPSDGEVYLGMGEGAAISQTLCEPIPAGQARSFALDIRRVYIEEPSPDAPAEGVYLEVWGGALGACVPGELLVTLDAGTNRWQRRCVTLRPEETVRDVTLTIAVDLSLPTYGYFVLDNLVPVDACP